MRTAARNRRHGTSTGLGKEMIFSYTWTSSERVSVGEKGEGHSMQMDQKQKRRGNQRWRVCEGSTDLCVKEEFPLGADEVLDPQLRSRQRDSSHQQDNQYQVRKSSREIHHLKNRYGVSSKLQTHINNVSKALWTTPPKKQRYGVSNSLETHMNIVSRALLTTPEKQRFGVSSNLETHIHKYCQQSSMNYTWKTEVQCQQQPGNTHSEILSAELC